MKQPSPQPLPEPDERTEAPIRALVAEDNDDLRMVLMARLRMMGVEATPAVNGEIAVDRALLADAEGRPFDLILMDMEMPIVDGYEATRRLRDRGHLGPILAMTAHDPGDSLDSNRFGCDGHVSKPIDWGALASAIREAVKQSRGPYAS